MNLHPITFLLVILLTSIGFADEAKLSDSKLGDTFALDKVARFVFVNEFTVDGGFAYEEKKLKGDTKGKLAEALKKASRQPYLTESDYTFVGFLARVMLLDRDGNPICTMQVVNSHQTVVFYGVTRKNGKNMIDDRYANIKSQSLARWVYDQLRANDPAELKRKQDRFRRHGETLETILGLSEPDPKSKEKKSAKPQLEERPR